MRSITGIPEDDLDLVISDLRREGAAIASIGRDEDGTWYVFFTAPSSGPQAEPQSADGSVSQPLPVSDAEIGDSDSTDIAVAARKIGPQAILYQRENGSSFVRSGGTRAWRNLNPGNIRMGSFASAHGAIGDDGEFAVFPDEASGMAAIEALLRTNSYFFLSLREAIHRYAPPVENDSDAYVDAIVRETGIAPGERLNTLEATQIGALAGAIRKIEGWRQGEEFAFVENTRIS
jgi:hypothetical protein